MLQLPAILDFPDKLIPLVTSLNDYSFFLIEGGRGSAKSHSVARLIIWICEQRQVRVVCGRETQKTIEQSVYTLFVDLIKTYNLNFEIQKAKITHRITGSVITFMGFREQGKVNIKGLEGVDILWIDEAEAITTKTLNIIIPTIRKENSLLFFTMNRFVRNDAVFQEFASDPKCLHIHIDYFENKFCPQSLIDKAEKCKQKNYSEYKHIWLGEPLDQTQDYLFNSLKLDKAKEVTAHKQIFTSISVMSVDLAAGGDLNVAKLIKGIDNTRFEEVETQSWSEPDTDITIGKIVALYSKWRPDLAIVDGGGLGLPIYCTLSKTIRNLLKFDGAGESRRANAGNQRADGYLTLREFIDDERLRINDKEALAQLEYIKIVYKPNGLVYIQPKKEMKEENGESPDHADSLMMGIYALNYFSHLIHDESDSEVKYIDNDFDPFE